MTTTQTVQAFHPQVEQVLRAIARRSFCTLATASATNRPHVAGVLYVADANTLYVSTMRTSRKARNIATNRPWATMWGLR